MGSSLNIPKPIIAVLLFVVLLCSCDLTDTSNQATQTSPEVPLNEHLIFQEDISGILTMGINPRPLTHDDPIPAFVQQPDGTFFDPAPTSTQCAYFEVNVAGPTQDYIAVIVGTVGTRRYALTIEISPDNPAYMKPGTELHLGVRDSSGSVEVYEMGGKNRRWLHNYGPNFQETVIVLHANRTSGTVDSWLATTDQVDLGATTTLHIQGDWRCG